MTPRPNPILRQLRPREVLDIRDGRGLTVRCLAGSLWITQYGDTDDVVLEAGECFVLDRPGLALVSAPIGPATVVVENPRPSSATAKAVDYASAGSRPSRCSKEVTGATTERLL
jgi:Protein of unknown function (DUF2917)